LVTAGAIGSGAEPSERRSERVPVRTSGAGADQVGQPASPVGQSLGGGDHPLGRLAAAEHLGDERDGAGRGERGDGPAGEQQHQYRGPQRADVQRREQPPMEPTLWPRAGGQQGDTSDRCDGDNEAA
jgi:hypothetical protein